MFGICWQFFYSSLFHSSVGLFCKQVNFNLQLSLHTFFVWSICRTFRVCRCTNDTVYFAEYFVMNISPLQPFRNGYDLLFLSNFGRQVITREIVHRSVNLLIHLHQEHIPSLFNVISNVQTLLSSLRRQRNVVSFAFLFILTLLLPPLCLLIWHSQTSLSPAIIN